MPPEFERCRKKGGRIRTESGPGNGLKKGQYRHVCYLRGKRYEGHVKRKKMED